MPPARENSKLTESDRRMAAEWIEQQLHRQALLLPEYAGTVATRRLNRDAYNNTIRDLFGLDLGFDHRFPVDGSGGEGFDNNGETLYLQPLLMERYIEAAEEILDQAIISPPFQFQKDFSSNTKSEIQLNRKGASLAELTPTILKRGRYEVSLSLWNQTDQETLIQLVVDGIPSKKHTVKVSKRLQTLSTQLDLERGIHTLEFKAGTDRKARWKLGKVLVESRFAKPTAAQIKIHEKIFQPKWKRHSNNEKLVAHKTIRDFATRAFRRPVTEKEIQPFLRLFERARTRGDPFEESIKLGLKGVLLAPQFLFLIESPAESATPQPINDFELASRLSYFLWTSMPDSELLELASAGKLHQPQVLKHQVERMLQDQKAQSFFRLFSGQWLGTKDVGGKVGPVGDQKGQGYTSELGFSLRDEPHYLLKHVFQQNRPLTDLIDSDYVFVNEFTAKHYGLPKVKGRKFQRVSVQNGQRGGLLGLGAVHMLTSTSNRTSPVLRGVWVHETLLGTHVPPPPDNIPDLNVRKLKQKKQTVREGLALHREQAACASCHNIIDPIGFGLENYDYLGRWRTTENGTPIDARATLPTGQSFNGPAELKQLLLKNKNDFIRHLSAKVLGYALGRSLVDRDAGTIEKIAKQVIDADDSAKQLILAVATSTPFLQKQKPITAARTTSH